MRGLAALACMYLFIYLFYDPYFVTSVVFVIFHVSSGVSINHSNIMNIKITLILVGKEKKQNKDLKYVLQKRGTNQD